MEYRKHEWLLEEVLIFGVQKTRMVVREGFDIIIMVLFYLFIQYYAVLKEIRYRIA